MIISSAMENSFYSIRMRASSREKHLSGGERLVPRNEISAVVAALTEQGLLAADGQADVVQCRVERIATATLRYGVLPDVSTRAVRNDHEGRLLAVRLLERAGVAAQVAQGAIQLLADGPGPGGTVMRGAVIMDARNGQRLEPDPNRGVRASRMDVTPDCRFKLTRLLQEHDLGHRRVGEALVLAGKVLSASGLVAELCWSDDPNYTTGYVAAPAFGYRRISALKPSGDPRGGRVFFVESGTSIADLVVYLEETPVLFVDHGTISPAQQWESDDA